MQTQFIRMLGNKPTTSAVTRIELLHTFLRLDFIGKITQIPDIGIPTCVICLR